jgi:dihydroflavonol-4-reductase
LVRLNLVTGGCGFIGRHLVGALVARGERVRVLDLRPLGSAMAGVEQVVGTITDPATVARATEGCERVFHLAANPNLWAPDPKSFDAVNHQGTRRMLEAAQKAGVQRFVYTSTESILKSYRAPKQSARALIDETVVLSLEDMPGPYCRSKYLAEQAAREAAAGGLPGGDRQPDHADRSRRRPADAAEQDDPRLPQRRDAGLSRLRVQPGRRARRRGGTDPGGGQGTGGASATSSATSILSLGELLAELQRLTGLAMPRTRIPYALAIVSALVSESLSNITKKAPIAPITGVRLARTSMAFDCSKARNELGWSCRTLEQSLRDAIAWMSGRGLLRRAVSGVAA